MKPQHNSSSTESGFTLIELLVVIAIIGILMSIVMVSFGKAQERGRNAARMADMAQVQSALEVYYVDNNTFPSHGASPYKLSDVSDLAPTYIDTLPSDPKFGGDTYDYRYYANAPKVGYALLVRVEGVDSGNDTWCRIVRNNGGGWATYPLCSSFESLQH